MLRLVAAAGLVTLSVGVTQPEFDCSARKLAYAQAAKLMGHTALAAGLVDVHDALQLATVCKDPFAAPAPPAAGSPGPAVASPLATLHVATTGDDSTADGSAAKPYGTLRAARDAARAKNDGPAGQTVGTIAVAAGRSSLPTCPRFCGDASAHTRSALMPRAPGTNSGPSSS